MIGQKIINFSPRRHMSHSLRLLIMREASILASESWGAEERRKLSGVRGLGGRF